MCGVCASVQCMLGCCHNARGLREVTRHSSPRTRLRRDDCKRGFGLPYVINGFGLPYGINIEHRNSYPIDNNGYPIDDNWPIDSRTHLVARPQIGSFTFFRHSTTGTPSFLCAHGHGAAHTAISAVEEVQPLSTCDGSTTETFSGVVTAGEGGGASFALAGSFKGSSTESS
eukprot:9500684-Pyramimonas_sp.AAC.1